MSDPIHISTQGTGGDIDVFYARGHISPEFYPNGNPATRWKPGQDYDLCLWFSRKFVAAKHIYVWRPSSPQVSPDDYCKTLRCPDWILNGWGQIPPNVFVEYWLERDDLPDWARALLEQITWT